MLGVWKEGESLASQNERKRKLVVIFGETEEAFKETTFPLASSFFSSSNFYFSSSVLEQHEVTKNQIDGLRWKY